MSSFVKYLEKKGHSQKGIAVHYRQLSTFLNWSEENHSEAEHCGHNDLLGYIKHLKKRGVKQRTVQLYLNSLKHYFNWLIGEKVRENNPVRNIDIKGIRRTFLYDILNRQELENLYYYYKIPEEDDRYKNQNWYKASLLAGRRNKVILGLMVGQGLGTADLGNLTIRDVKLREGKVFIAGSRKSNERELPLLSYQMLDLMEYTSETRKKLLELSGKTSEQLFISIGSSTSFGNTMTLLLRKLKEQNSRVGSVRQLRASVITHWLKNHNLREVQYMAGHRYISSTEAYLINDLEDLQEDIARFHPIG